MNLLFNIIFLINFEFIFNRRLCFHGRPNDKHGMLGIPKSVGRTCLSTNDLPKEKWFEQKLNHFDPTDDRKWKQRYFISEKYYTKGGPIFVLLGGEGSANISWVVEGQMAMNYAKKFGAISIQLEHRYYGQSRPTPNLTLDNLRYLTSEQALQDTAYFIQYLTDKLSLNDNKWIVFGGSYSGSLAAWFRLKYPHLCAGAIATSAPIVAVLDFKDYLEVVEKSLGEKCSDSFRKAFVQLTDELSTPMGQKNIDKQFKLCDPFDANDKNDIPGLMDTLITNIQFIVQFNKDNREDTLATNITIDVICDVMTDESNSSKPLDRYIKVNDIILNAYNSKCIDYKYNKFVKIYSETNWNSTAAQGGRQWIYQTCIEFGFFQSTDLMDQPFGHSVPVDFFIQQCIDLFGEKFNSESIQKSIDFTNNFYGGCHLNVRKVVFPNGSIDPWKVLGVSRDLNEEALALLINGTAHCADMYSDSDSDPQSLKDARNFIIKYLNKFLNEK